MKTYRLIWPLLILGVVLLIWAVAARAQPYGNVLQVLNEPAPEEISDLEVGQLGFAVPWAYKKTNKVNKDFTIFPTPFGTASMAVYRYKDNEYILDYSPEDSVAKLKSEGGKAK